MKERRVTNKPQPGAGTMSVATPNGCRPPSHYRSRSQENLASFRPGLEAPSGCAIFAQHDAVTNAASGLPKVNSTNAINVGQATLPAPVKELAVATSSVNGCTKASTSSSVPAVVRRAADMRIKKTKNTVTELQRSKQGLEAQLSDLTRLADTRQAENATLKFENRRLRERYAEELNNLKKENESLRNRPLTSRSAESDDQTQTTSRVALAQIHRIMVDAGTSPLPSRVSSVTSTDDAANGICSNVDTSPAVAFDWDRQSSCSEMSLACLQDRIVQMEETHYSTTEELQATLAELTELQDIVDEMNNEIQQLTTQNKTVTDALQQRNHKLDNAHLQIENLKYLLLTGFQQRQQNSSEDNEQHLMAVLKSTHEEYEDLKYRYFEAVQALHTLKAERQQLVDMCELFKERLNEKHGSGNNSSERDTNSPLDAERSKRLNELEAIVLESKLRQNTLQRDNQTLQNELKSQSEHVVEIERQLALVQHECDSYKQAHTDNNPSTTTTTTITSDMSLLKQQVDELMLDKTRLQERIDELLHAQQLEREEWSEFQADLQTAVVVANQFKVEAQEDIDRLTEETQTLKKRCNLLTDELALAKERSSQQTLVTHRSPLMSTPVHNIQTKVNSYLKQTDSTTMHQLSAPSPSNTRTLSTPHSRSDCVSTSSVRALIESLEKADTSKAHTCAWIRSPRNVSSSPNPPSARLTSSEHMILPPIKSAASEGNILTPTNYMQTPGTAPAKCNAGSTNKLNDSPDQRHVGGPIPFNAISEEPMAPTSSSTVQTTNSGGDNKPQSISSAAVATDTNTTSPPKAPKSILVTRGSPLHSASHTSRKAAYFDADGVDALARLMKDAPRGSRRNALLKWCQARLCAYKDVEITNFSSSWNDGLAFCALLHSYVPHEIPFDTLDVINKRRNFTLAFAVAAKHGVAQELNVDEMLGLERPDWQAIMSYVTAVYKHLEPQEQTT